MIYDVPKLAFFGALTRYGHSDLSLYTQVQAGWTMRLCDELLTSVVSVLVIWFVHVCVPTTVRVVQLFFLKVIEYDQEVPQ